MIEVLRRRGDRILAHRWRTPFGELDLWIESRQGIRVAIEVKTLQRKDALPTRVSLRQLCRLKRIHTYLIENFGPTRFFVCFVTPPDRLCFIELSEFP